MADRRSPRRPANRRRRSASGRDGGSFLALALLAALAAALIGGGAIFGGSLLLGSSQQALPSPQASASSPVVPLATSTHLPPSPTATAAAHPATSPQSAIAAPPTAAPTSAPAPPARPAPSSSPVGAVSPVPRSGGAVVALTFDAGADRGHTADILDVLRQNGVPATFGITGQWARSQPDLVRRIAADGHLVINHTLDHRSFTGASDNLGGLSSARRRAELEEADAIIAPLIGRSTKPWYRLPYGDDDARVAADVAPAGYTRKAGWTVDSLGWRGISAAEIVSRCLRLAAPNAVYVFHVGSSSRDGPALPAIIEGLRARGFSFATMADLQ